MSSLLEQAIIDAAALKEAALKNAESSVLEKYSQEVKGVLNTLLEQDAPGPDASFLSGIPMAYEDANIDGPEDEEMIEIDFDNLKARFDAEEAEGVEPTPDELLSPEDTAEEIFGGLPATPSAPTMEPTEMAAAPFPAPGELSEDIEMSDEFIEALAEELAVDVTARLGGWSPLASAETQEHAEEMALEEEAADAQSEEVTDEKDQYLKLYESQISELMSEVGGLRSLLSEAKDQLNILIVENAKLHFQNKALNSASLNERQKKNIVEAVRNANSVEEMKVLYETLQSAVGRQPVRRTESLREAVSRPTTSMLLSSNRSNSSSSTGVDPNMDRMLRLAGLKQ